MYGSLKNNNNNKIAWSSFSLVVVFPIAKNISSIYMVRFCLRCYIYNRKVFVWLKSKYNEIVIRPALFYGNDCWGTEKIVLHKMNIDKMWC